ncbi:substrate-binding periplasmic protein [Colwellia piezophila]|uniref:substrate-binding periplasmic protein n=1 Tax=Colwellia piezophila TaxID=211668 RepID=UPI000364B8F8|nr:transporter substrate-binding domain-containing protein [Colwellia piezophila]
MNRISFMLILLLLVSPVYAQQLLLFSGAKDPVTDISSKVIIEAYKRIGIEAKIEQFPSARSLAMANKGTVDGEVGRIAGIESVYPNLIRIPVAINVVEGMVFSKNDINYFPNWQALKAYIIGIKRGDIFIEKGTKGMQVVPVADSNQLFKMLIKERTDVVVLAKVTGLSQLKILGIKGIKVHEPAITQVNLFHYVHKKNAYLIPEITNVLKEMEAEGRIAVIRKSAIRTLLID